MDRRRCLAVAAGAALGQCAGRRAESQENGAFSGQVYLAVGPGGQRMVSSDGMHWTNHISWGEPYHDQNDLNVTGFFRGAAFVGGGYSIARMTATRDGKTWRDGVLPKGTPIFGLEVLNDALFAVDLRGQVYRTADGEAWESIGKAQMPTPTHWIRGTVIGNGILLGSGDYGPAMAFDPKSGKISVTQMAGQVDKQPGLRRTAYGNGVFVVGGQSGLLATSTDGVEWRNNEVHPERGNITCVIWTGTEFLALTDLKQAWHSTNGADWAPRPGDAPPRQMVRAGKYLYGWSYPPTQVSRSLDGVAWEKVPNEKEFHVKHVAVGKLSGGAPPNIPDGPVPWAGMKPKPKA